MVPASNASVPLTVVMRTRSSVPERAFEPAPAKTLTESVLAPFIPATQTLLLIDEIVTTASNITEAAVLADTTNPVEEATLVVFDVQQAPVYPDVSTDPAPS